MSFLDLDDALIQEIKIASFESGLLSSQDEVPRIILEYPDRPEHGELSTPVALSLSKLVKRPSLEVANTLSQALQARREKSPLKDKINKIEVAPPGFINFFLTHQAMAEILITINKKGASFGSSNLGRGEKVLIEFTSANPTGPLSVAHGRQAAVGDSLRRILAFGGFRVKTEYYLNDEGNQIKLLGSSIRARYLELLGEIGDFPQGGYEGYYVRELAKELNDKYQDRLRSRSAEFFADYGMAEIIQVIKRDLKSFEVRFDSWFSQKAFSSTGAIEKSLAELKKKGFIYEKDGARWFSSTQFGDDKDRVVVKSDGSYTYLTPDIAYHQNKVGRGFKKVINIWGPDHHGYINRLKGAWQAMGYDRDDLSILIIQLATLFRCGRPVRVSTRAGEFISLEEVVDEVGKDASRFFFLMRKSDSQLNFDLEIAKSQTPENPVFYIQYAHARVSSILRMARFKEWWINLTSLRPELIKEKEEIDILRLLHRFPSIVSSCAIKLEPFWLVSYLQELAGRFHNFYDRHRVLSGDRALSRARLHLVKAVKTVLATGLDLLGVSAPDKM